MEISNNIFTLENILKEKGINLIFWGKDKDKIKELQTLKIKDKTNEAINKYKGNSIKING